MEKLTGLFQKKKTPREQVREWQSRLRGEQRSLDRQIREIEREEKNVQKSIREAAKRNDMTSAKNLAREIVQSRRVVAKLHNNKAQLNSVSMHLGESFATVRAVGHLQKSTEVMKMVNNLMKVPEIQQNMMEMSKEMMKAGVIEEMVSDTMDDVLDDEETEEETEEELNRVLDEVAGEYTSQLPSAGLRPKKERQPAAAQKQPAQAVAEGAGDDDDAELESLQAQLASVKS